MPTSSFEHAPCPRASCGFTLMELLVVMLLVALTLGLGLGISGYGTPAGADALERLAREVDLAVEEAALNGELWGLDFYRAPDGDASWRWLVREAEGWSEVEDARMAPLAASGTFPPDSLPALAVDGVAVQPESLVMLGAGTAGAGDFRPEVVVLPTRDTTPFRLRLTGGDSSDDFLAVDMLARIWRDEPPRLPR